MPKLRSDVIGTELEGQCMGKNCRTKRTFIAEEVTISAVGAGVAKGKCPECGTTVCRMVGQIREG